MDSRKLGFAPHLLLAALIFVPAVAFALPSPNIELGLPFQNSGDPSGLASIISELIKFVGVISVMSLSWGGVLFASSYGEDSKLKKAKNILIYSLAGVLLSMTGYPIIRILSGLSLF